MSCSLKAWRGFGRARKGWEAPSSRVPGANGLRSAPHPTPSSQANGAQISQATGAPHLQATGAPISQATGAPSLPASAPQIATATRSGVTATLLLASSSTEGQVHTRLRSP